MIPLGNFIDTELKKEAAAVYHERAPKDATFPHVVYHFPNSLPDEIREDFIMEVNIWGHGQYTLPLEQLADSISRRLEKRVYRGNGIAVRIHKINQLEVPDPDPDIKRRLLRFECRTIFTKE